MPGRLRVFIPALTQADGFASAAATLLDAQAGITQFRINRTCGSLVLEFEDPDVPMRLATALDGLTVESLIALAPSPDKTPDQADEAQGWSRLALASLALATSWVGGPLGTLAALPLIGWTAYPTVEHALSVLSDEQRLNVDFLDSLAIAISTAQGQFAVSTLMIWLIALGDAIRDFTATKSRRAIAELLDYRSHIAWVIRDGESVEVPVDALTAGDVVILHPGELIPVDGVIEKGTGTVDQRSITGEGVPTTVRAGTAVFATSVVCEGLLHVRATNVGTETVAGRIVRTVEEAPMGETRIQNYAERWADRLVAPSLAVASGFYAVSRDLNRLLSMVIVDYGTGIRVAAPTSILASLRAAARQGILIKSGSHIEKLDRVDAVVFDKTGTLTTGVLRMEDAVTIHDFPASRILALAAAAESRLSHPVADAILRKAAEAHVAVPGVDDWRYTVGLGVEARLNGTTVHVGNERFMSTLSLHLNGMGCHLRAMNDAGYSAVLVAVDGEVVAAMPYADAVRSESADVVKRLRARGVRRLVMMTGDNPTVAGAVALRLGIDEFVADVMPDEKATTVRQLQKRGCVVAMVGDGINDSPALAHADVGISLGHATDVACETADVLLMHNDLRQLLTALDLSRDALSLVRQNYGIVVGLNALAFALAIPRGWISPGAIAAISNGSAILATLNAARPVLFA